MIILNIHFQLNCDFVLFCLRMNFVSDLLQIGKSLMHLGTTIPVNAV